MLSFGVKRAHVRDHAFNILGKVQEFVQIIMRDKIDQFLQYNPGVGVISTCSL